MMALGDVPNIEQAKEVLVGFPPVPGCSEAVLASHCGLLVVEDTPCRCQPGDHHTSSNSKDGMPCFCVQPHAVKAHPAAPAQRKPTQGCALLGLLLRKRGAHPTADMQTPPSPT